MSWLRSSGMIWLVKVIIFLVMAWNTGALQGILQGAKEGSLPADLAQIRKKETECFAKFRVAVAQDRQERGAAYSPEDYFKDLIEICSKEKQLGIRAPIRPWVDALNQMMLKNIELGVYSHRDLSKAREVYGAEADFAAGLYREEEKWKGVDWRKLFLWFLWFYLYNLLPVTVLYMMWAIEDRREKGISLFPNPLSFAWRVITHPVYLSRFFWAWFNQGSREIIAEARLRQTKEKFFVYLSEKETRRIEEFAKSTLLLSIWGKALLAEGLKPVHTLAAALLVTLIFTLLPKPANAKARYANNPGCKLEASLHLARMSIGNAKVEINSDGGFGWELRDKRFFCEEVLIFSHIPLVGWFISSQPLLCLQEVWRRIFHIPLCRLFNSAFGETRFAN